MERAYADSEARHAKQFDMLLNGFLKLEKMMQEQHLINIISVQPTPTRWPPPPALPNEYDGDQSKGQVFLTSCQTYIHLCSDSFHAEQTKITWALSYMKSGRAAKWAKWIFQWEEKNSNYPKFLDWEEFRKEFQKDFCPAHSDVAAINKLESTTYYQKSHSINDYLNKFVELIAKAGYMYRSEDHSGKIPKRIGPTHSEHHRYNGLWTTVRCASRRLVQGSQNSRSELSCQWGFQTSLPDTHICPPICVKPCPPYTSKHIPDSPSHCAQQPNSRQSSTDGHRCEPEKDLHYH